MYQGLANTGNTCSINTLVQCIGHCPLLREFLLETSIPVQKKETQKYSIYEELKELLRQMWKEHNSLVPQRFLAAFYESIGEAYSPGDQFDFTEMWMLLLQNLLEETHQPKYLSPHQQVQVYPHPALEYVQKLSHTAWSTFFAKNNSPLNDLVHGTQIQQIQCTACKRTYHNVEPISFLYVDIEDGMEQGMEKLLSSEQVDEWTCDTCKQKGGIRTLRFWRLPKVWVIILKRFNHMQKLGHPVHVLPEFTVGKEIEMATSTEPSAAIQYELKAMGNHYGSLHGGHYNAICKNKQDWCLYDDLSVQKIPQIETVFQENRHVYVLFYERRS